MEEEQPIEYKDFLQRLNLSDDKISEVLYDLYKYNIENDEKENIEQEKVL